MEHFLIKSISYSWSTTWIQISTILGLNLTLCIQENSSGYQ